MHKKQKYFLPIPNKKLNAKLETSIAMKTSVQMSQLEGGKKTNINRNKYQFEIFCNSN